jgi:hypothetical protein
MNYISADRHVPSDPVRVLYLTVHHAALIFPGGAKTLQGAILGGLKKEDLGGFRFFESSSSACRFREGQ